MELAETVAALWGLILAAVILNLIVMEIIQSGKEKRFLQREIDRFLRNEVEYAIWRDRQKKAKTP
jgi:hypothetical protein